MYHTNGPSVAYTLAISPAKLLEACRNNLRQRRKQPLEIEVRRLKHLTPTAAQKLQLTVQHIHTGLVPESRWPGAHIKTLDHLNRAVEIVIPGEARNDETDFILIRGL